MSAPTFAGTTAIVGIGATEFSKDSGRSTLRLAVEACDQAIVDAGLQPADIDGMVTYTADDNHEIDVARSLGVPELTHFSRVHHSGGAGCGSVAMAAMAVATGVARAVLVYRAFNERSVHRFGTGVQGRQPEPTPASVDLGWSSPFGLLTPASWVAMFAQRYMHEYGATTEDFGRVAVGFRDFAATNPAAHFFERPITLEDHQASRWIVKPIRLLDCCQETDGGQALVVTTLERARDLAQPPAVIRSVVQGCCDDQQMMKSYYRESITGIPELEMSARQLWEHTGLGPDDIGAAVLYDHFTPMILPQLEAFGFCGRGEAKDFVAEGNIGRGGRLPVNTNGGQLGEAYIHGLNGIAEAVRLVRGTSVNQPGTVDHALATSAPAVPSGAMILGVDA